MFRRNSADATDGTAQDSQGVKDSGAPAKDRPAAEAGKGRPTPKRSEAERNRYQSITGGRTAGARAGGSATPARPLTKEEKARQRDRGREDRAHRMDAMKRGEDWALGARDKGPAKRLARDYVDTHRRPSEYYMYVLVLLLVALLSHNKALNSYTSYLVVALVVIIIVDGYFIRRALARLVAERLPGESARGLTMYAVFRALQIRRMRMPAPRLKPGDKF
ncbi:MAG TPA: DUF3043 domain-containing protein [Trebonia sp.]|nr:DUF3043 domain-containing protein [Trebonia sp.]